MLQLPSKPRLITVLVSLILGWIYRYKWECLLPLFKLLRGQTRKSLYFPPPTLAEEINQLAIIKVLKEKLGEARPFRHPKFIDFYKDHFIRDTIYQDDIMSFAQSHYCPTTKTLVCVVRLRHRTCGHKDIIHGGLCAALFDDILGEVFYCDSEGKYMGFTASLTINYRQPMASNNTYLFCVKVVKRDGRKVYLKGQVRDAVKMQDENIPVRSDHDAIFADLISPSTNLKLYAESEALFIIPKTPINDDPVSFRKV